ncbi:MAG: tRNA (adenosine(37)-N6)-dimethylallyltransferase MiaA [Sheuella sp.]|nr:tRNA (adenosine(37)-N6)-dimethylallyltransferase MiaA [Sheuella sp.]
MTGSDVPLLCLAGPTASGKSAIACAIAQRWPTEIINVDSATIYRGMDIGTAKPSRTEQQTIKHHLLDIRDPSESYSAAAFRHDALQCAAQIKVRGHMPLLAGGTMLYFKALRDGLNNLPTANPEIRIEIETQAAAIGWPAMHTKLGVIDPVTAARLSPNDSQRVGRALEIWRISGKPMSELLGHAQQTDAPVPTVTISLEPSDRSVLHTRIEQRFDLMLETGFIEEVRALHQRKDLHTGLPSVRCVGYRQIWSMLEGEISLEQAREQAIAATRQLAKRQLTWLRSLPGRLVVDSLSQHAVQEVIDLVAQQQP